MDEVASLTPEDGPPLLGAFIPDCDIYGHYEAKQCHGSTGHCWCVDTLTGTELGGTRRGPTEPQPNCNRGPVSTTMGKPMGYISIVVLQATKNIS